ncbi:MAG: hypothetical protein WBC33_07790 [Conexibacter sp.]
MSPLDDVLEEVLTPQLPAPVAGALAPSPYNFEFTGEDALRLTAHNSQAGAVVAVHYRMKRRDGSLVAHAQPLALTSDRAANTLEFPIGEGYLLNVSVFASSGAPRRGQTFVRLQVIRGLAAAAIVLGTLVQGYVTGNQDRAWPGSPIEGATNGDGYVRHVTGTDPAAGINMNESVPTGARWRLLAFVSTLLTDANVANRRPLLGLSVSGQTRVRVPAPATIPASTQTNFWWALDLIGATANGTVDIVTGLPDAPVLLAGDIINVQVSGFQAGDDWAAPAFAVEEWLEV